MPPGRSEGSSVGKGRGGEEAAEAFYRRRGYKSLGRNLRVGRAELDLVVRRKDLLIFVEVKSRGQGSLASGADSVNPAKRRKLIRAAEGFMAMEKIGSDCQARFDVCEVELDEAGRPRALRVIEDAFRDEESF